MHDRNMVVVLRSQGASLRSIARQLQRNPSNYLPRIAAQRVNYKPGVTNYRKRRMPAPNNIGDPDTAEQDGQASHLVPMLADEGKYLAAGSSFYQVLHAAGQQQHRGRTAAPTRKRPPIHEATGPNQRRACSEPASIARNIRARALLPWTRGRPR